MATGPRQERIGNTPTGGEQQSAQPGPDFTGAIRAAKSSAESSAESRKSREGGLGVPDTTSSPTRYGSGVGGG